MPDLNIQPSEIICREQFGDLLNHHGLFGPAVEIGTDKAAFAGALLDRWKGGPLICVDPWTDEIEGYDDALSNRPRWPDRAIAMNVLARHADRVQVLAMTSMEAARHAQLDHVGTLSFVYIDGNHAYEAVRDDLDAWYRRLTPGGIIAGHDFNLPEVSRAVGEFAAFHCAGPIRLVMGAATSWYIKTEPRG